MPQKWSPVNLQFVGVQGEHLVVLRPAVRMTPDEAVVHAGWLAVMAELNGASRSIEDVVAAIKAAG